MGLVPGPAAVRRHLPDLVRQLPRRHVRSLHQEPGHLSTIHGARPQHHEWCRQFVVLYGSPLPHPMPQLLIECVSVASVARLSASTFSHTCADLPPRAQTLSPPPSSATSSRPAVVTSARASVTSRTKSPGMTTTLWWASTSSTARRMGRWGPAPTASPPRGSAPVSRHTLAPLSLHSPLCALSLLGDRWQKAC